MADAGHYHDGVQRCTVVSLPGIDVISLLHMYLARVVIHLPDDMLDFECAECPYIFHSSRK
jgi:hypothetical protein